MGLGVCHYLLGPLPWVRVRVSVRVRVRVRVRLPLKGGVTSDDFTRHFL